MPSKKKTIKAWAVRFEAKGFKKGLDPRWVGPTRSFVIDEYQYSFGSHPLVDGQKIVRVEVREL